MAFPGRWFPMWQSQRSYILSLLALLTNFVSVSRAKRDNKERRPENSPVDRIHLNHLLFFMVPSFLLMPAMKKFGVSCHTTWVSFFQG